MQRSILSLALVLLLASLFVMNVAHVRADDDDAPASDEAKPTEDSDSTRTDDEEIDVDVIRPASEIITTVYFPDEPDKKFAIGDDVTVLVGIQNTGKDDFNMSYIGASLHNPFDLAYYIQNFTWRGVDGTVEAGTEQTFEYTFRPDARLEPLTFWFSAFIGYNNTDTGVPHRSFFYNSTIELVEKAAESSVRRTFTYVFAIAVAGVVAYFAYTLSSPKGSSSSERGTRGGDDSSSGKSGAASWVPDKVYTQGKAKAVGRKRDNKKAAPAAPKSPTSGSDS